MTAARVRPGQSHTAKDLRRLEELAERPGVGIENSRLHEETVPARSRAQQLHRFAQAAVDATHIEVVYEASLRVESAEQTGTTFHIDLPRLTSTPGQVLLGSMCASHQPELILIRGAQAAGSRAAAAEASPAREPAPSTPTTEGDRAGSRRTILVVDDDRDVREALGELLEFRGFAVDCAANGAEALERLRSGAPLPSAVLLDLMMPIMDGYEFLAERRKDPVLAALAVIAVTAAHGVDTRRLGDAVPVVAKPISMPQLMSLLPWPRAEGTPGDAPA